MATARGRGWAFAAGAAATLLLLLLGGAILIFNGSYNVAATAGHYKPVSAIIETTMHESVEARSENIQAPARFSEAEIAAGAAEYKAMCEHCHGGPGVTRASWAEGIFPHPPEIGHAAEEWNASEIFWIVKHGIKMTAMPAFGPTHDDKTLWNIVGFVNRIPKMTPAEYAAFKADAGHHGGGGGEAGHHGGGESEAGHHGPEGAPKGHGH